MKIIDLLNKIANGEEIPKEINYKGTLYSYNDDIDYENQYGGFLMDSAVCICPEDLNDEVEIIEEPQEYKIPQEHKIPEKIEMVGCSMKVNILDKETLLPTENMQTEFLIKKINEILKYLEEKEE